MTWETTGTKTEKYRIGYGKQDKESGFYDDYDDAQVTTKDGKLTHVTVDFEIDNEIRGIEIPVNRFERLVKLYELLGREGKIPTEESKTWNS